MLKRTDRIKPTGSLVRRRLEAAIDKNDTIHADVETLRQAQDDNALTPLLVYATIASIEAALLTQLRALTDLAEILVKEQ